MNTDQSSIQFFLEGAKHSRDNAAHWFRYLRKIVSGGKIILSQEDLSRLLSSEELSCFQKVTLRRAMTQGTPTYQYVMGLNEPWKPVFWPELLRRMQNGSQETS